MTIRDLLFGLLDAGTDSLVTEVVLFSEHQSKNGSFIIQHDHLDIGMNGKCLQILMYDDRM